MINIFINSINSIKIETRISKRTGKPYQNYVFTFKGDITYANGDVMRNQEYHANIFPQVIVRMLNQQIKQGFVSFTSEELMLRKFDTGEKKGWNLTVNVTKDWAKETSYVKNDNLDYQSDEKEKKPDDIEKMLWD